MPQKNSLASVKQPPKQEGYKPVLPANSEGEEQAAAPKTKKKTGRPPLKKAEKRDYKITVSMTREQGKKIKEKAGLAGEATYLYDLLEKAGAFK